MEMSLSPNPDAFYYTSAPASPRRYNLNGFFFLSMPTSPTWEPSRDPSGFNSVSRTPETAQDLSPFDDNFEFEGSKRFYVYDNGSGKSQDLAMAYADELFCEGKMLPLRPPPQARFLRPDRKPGNGSTASSPGAWTSMLKVPFLRQRSLWNDEFDPFMAALNKVKEGNDVVSTKGKNKAHLRRAKSLSPLRRPIGPARWTTHHQCCTETPNSCRFLSLRRPCLGTCGRLNRQIHLQNGRFPSHSPCNIAHHHQHKRLGLSPNARIDGLGVPVQDAFGPILKPKEDVGKKQRIKKFLMKNASFGREVSGEKRGERTPLLMRKFHSSGNGRFRSATMRKTANINAIMRISREMKTVMKHRARLFFCLVKGFGIKGTRKIR